MVDQIWPGRVANMIERAYTFSDEIMPPDMVDQLKRRARQLWVVWDGEQVVAAVVTRIVKLKSSGLACQVTAAGGTALATWKSLISEIEAFAKQESCRRVTIEGRVGWERIFSDYRRTRVVIEKEV